MVQLTTSQKEAVSLLEGSKFSLLTGGGGTGKTTTLAEWIKQTRSDLTYCFAPTGKAAQRMQEAFHECGVSLGARTIHAGLQPKRVGYDGNGWSFVYNKDNPLSCDRVIVDEFSMVANAECNWLFDAIRPGTKVVCVGDDYQLPPVGKGRPFKDMIESGQFTHANLTEVHRYAGRIAQVCKAIRTNKPIVPSTKLDLNPEASETGPENYRHIERRNPSDILSVMDALCDRVKSHGFNPVKDMQVVVTRNDKGGICRDVVNPRLQHLLNPNGERWSKCPFRVGDKVVCRKNGFRPDHELIGKYPEKTGDKVYVANGEDGIVVHLSDRNAFVKFREGIIPFSRGGWGKELVMGYALTTHSSQGSGWPVVVYLIDDCRLNDRNLVYTALSRPKKILFTVGQLGVMRQQTLKSQLKHRKTFLKEMMTGVM